MHYGSAKDCFSILPLLAACRSVLISCVFLIYRITEAPLFHVIKTAVFSSAILRTAKKAYCRRQQRPHQHLPHKQMEETNGDEHSLLQVTMKKSFCVGRHRKVGMYFTEHVLWILRTTAFSIYLLTVCSRLLFSLSNVEVC